MKITAHLPRPFRQKSDAAGAQASALSVGPIHPADERGSAQAPETAGRVQTVNLGLLQLKIHRPSAMEVALRDRMKKIEQKGKPYVSSHGKASVKLNKKVTVSPHEGASPKERRWVVCRHLATVFAQELGKKVQ